MAVWPAVAGGICWDGVFAGQVGEGCGWGKRA